MNIAKTIKEDCRESVTISNYMHSRSFGWHFKALIFQNHYWIHNLVKDIVFCFFVSDSFVRQGTSSFLFLSRYCWVASLLFSSNSLMREIRTRAHSAMHNSNRLFRPVANAYCALVIVAVYRQLLLVKEVLIWIALYEWGRWYEPCFKFPPLMVYR